MLITRAIKGFNYFLSMNKLQNEILVNSMLNKWW